MNRPSIENLKKLEKFSSYRNIFGVLIPRINLIQKIFKEDGYTDKIYLEWCHLNVKLEQEIMNLSWKLQSNMKIRGEDKPKQ